MNDAGRGRAPCPLTCNAPSEAEEKARRPVVCLNPTTPQPQPATDVRKIHHKDAVCVSA